MANLITDVAGIRVGHAADMALASGVTAILFDAPAVTAVEVRGGAPAGRCVQFAPEMTVERADAILLSGGSAFGLDATGGAMAFLREQGRGFGVGNVRVPIVAQAICFDLLNGGDKNWGRQSPYEALGHAACVAAGAEFALGSAGGGLGATTVNLKGGLGSASARVGPWTVGAIVIVNAIASAVVGNGPHFWAAPYERDGEFGGRGLPKAFAPADLAPRWKGGPENGTTIALVATDAALTPAQARRFAIMADAGLPRALRFAHAPLDGDTVFAAATGHVPLGDPIQDLTALGVAAADTLARAIARGVYEATALPFPDALPSWGELFGR